jgi:hypothetical protein
MLHEWDISVPEDHSSTSVLSRCDTEIGGRSDEHNKLFFDNGLQLLTGKHAVNSFRE